MGWHSYLNVVSLGFECLDRLVGVEEKRRLYHQEFGVITMLA